MRSRICCLLLLCSATRSFAQPAPPASQPAPPATEPDFARATELYNAASQAMTEGRATDAARDFLAAYEITKDPVLFFKIGSAYEKAGTCTEAISYYERYVAEAKPAENFAALAHERIAACKAQLPAAEPAAPPPPEPAPGTTPDAAPAPVSATPTVVPIEQPTANKDRAWLFVGGALTFVTAGAVLAYSTSSAEQDIKDLYISAGGKPPAFDEATKKRYDDLVSEGRRYQYLAWTSFGLAAGCAVGATIFFLRDRGDLTVTPVVTPKEAGVAATLRF